MPSKGILEEEAERMKNMNLLLLLLLAHACLEVFVGGVGPPAPAFCDDNSGACFVTNSYGAWNTRQTCKVSGIAYPATEQELVEAVAYGVKHSMKMKAVSRLSHSIPPLACPGGDMGLLISTSKLIGNIIIVNQSSMEVVVDSGVQLHDLLDVVARSGLALPASPYWNGLSVGGIIGTGSHGSSLHGKGSAVHDHVVEIRMVGPASSAEAGYAKVVSLSEADGDRFHAALVSLGTLGVISQVKLKLQPMFKRSVINVKSSDVGLEDRIVEFGSEHEFGDVTWYPSKKEAVYRQDDRVAVGTRGDGVNEYVGFQPTLAAVITTQRALEEEFEAKRSSKAKCTTSATQISLVQLMGYGLKNIPGLFTGYPIVGFQHRMQSAGGCQNSASKLMICPWDSTHNGLFYHEAGVTIPINRIRDFIADVKRLRDSNDPSSFCGIDLYAGILLRFVRRSDALLGKQFDGVDVGFTYYRARNGSTPRLEEDVWEEIEQMALFKYGGLPHWGKNKNVAFIDPTSRYPKLARFIKAKKELDPRGFFSSEWSDSVLGTTGSTQLLVDRENCALEGMCLCSRDEQCAPDKGYYCRPGKVFTGARVCRYGASKSFAPRIRV